MVDRAGLARLLGRSRANSTLLCTSRELSDVAANNLTRDAVGISSRGVQPTEEMREANRVSVVRSVLQDSTEFELWAQSPAGLLIVRREEDTFVVSFGHAWQKLEDHWLQADFGLRVALNSIPPDKIIEIRAEQVFEKWHIASERAPRASFVHEFGVDFDRDIVASLDGIPSTPLFGRHVRGGTNMRLEASFSKLGDVLDKSATLFRSSAYKKRWPEVGNVNPVDDPAMTQKLDERLDSEFESGEAQKKLVL